VEGRGRGEGGEMTQTLYAHMNKRKKKEVIPSICNSVTIYQLKTTRGARDSYFRDNYQEMAWAYANKY
jgi:hypothetical protein